MHEPELKPLVVSSLIVDPEVQRGLDSRRVNKIAEELNFDALGTITVSRRANGSYHIIDGQHRVAAVRLAGGDEEKVMCRVFSGLTLQEEAEMFRLLNNTARPYATDLFRVRVIGGDPVAIGISKILDKHGWRVTMTTTSRGGFAAVRAIERLYRLDPDAVDKTMATVTRAWGLEPTASDGRIIEGVGLVYARFGTAVEPADLVDRLAKFPGGPANLLGRARGLRELVGGVIPQAVAEIVVETYNRSRRTKALPAWRSK